MGTVTMSLFQAKTPAIVAAAGFIGIAVFQAALALGAPLGRAAWGGAQPRLTPRLRVASGFAVAVWALATSIILGRAGLRLSAMPPVFDRWGTLALIGVMAASAIINFASRSSWERLFWGPVTLLLAALGLLVVA